MRDSMFHVEKEDCTCQICGMEYDNKPDTIHCCSQYDE